MKKSIRLLIMTVITTIFMFSVTNDDASDLSNLKEIQLKCVNTITINNMLYNSLDTEVDTSSIRIFKELEMTGLECNIKEPVYEHYTTTSSEENERQYETGILTASGGVNYNINGNKETYYNLDMGVIVSNAYANGISGEYWIREDGVKMLGDYIMVAACWSIYPYGSLVDTSLGTGIVVDTGGFAESDPYQLDIAVSW